MGNYVEVHLVKQEDSLVHVVSGASMDQTVYFKSVVGSYRHDVAWQTREEL